VLVILTSLAAALAFAVASYLKHRSAEAIPSAADTAASIMTIARGTVRDPVWIGGLAADAVGLVLQVVALRLGALSVVQPLLVTTVVFALVLRHRLYRRVPRRDFVWAAAAVVALAAFLLLAGTIRPRTPAAPDRTPAVIAVVLGVILATSCVLGRRASKRARSAALLGIAVGVIYAGTAALLKALTTIASRDVTPLATSWQLYVLVILGGAGLLLNQVAFQAGPITASLPALSTVDPLASIAIGVAVYDEPIRRGLTASVGLTAALLVLGVAIIQLARAPA
jgi:hypothetical protein